MNSNAADTREWALTAEGRTEYDAALSACVVADRADRAILRVYGRDPVGMVHNLVTNDVAGTGVDGATYAALLTPKGRMVADLRIIRRQHDLLLECDAGARTALLDTWKRSVPPLFARVEDVSDRLAVLGVYGPAAAATLSTVLAEPVAADAPELDLLIRHFTDHEVMVLATRDNAASGFDVIVSCDARDALRSALESAGARPIRHATLEVLRIEAGRPGWGTELDPDVIPLEAGLLERAISTTKGCYTGQEVIIRILHRGHVNRHLRGVLLGDAPAPPRGTPLHRPGEEKVVGNITSAVWSPAFRQSIGLAFVRREVVPPATLRIGSPDGANAHVVVLPYEMHS